MKHKFCALSRQGHVIQILYELSLVHVIGEIRIKFSGKRTNLANKTPITLQKLHRDNGCTAFNPELAPLLTFLIENFTSSYSVLTFLLKLQSPASGPAIDFYCNPGSSNQMMADQMMLQITAQNIMIFLTTG